jgi:hypothetical protein
LHDCLYFLTGKSENVHVFKRNYFLSYDNEFAGELKMNDFELKKIMKEIELIIDQLAECNYCKNGMNAESKKVLRELFELKIQQACEIKRAS